MGLWSNGYDVCFTWIVIAEGSRFDPGQTHFFDYTRDYGTSSITITMNYRHASKHPRLVHKSKPILRGPGNKPSEVGST